MHIQVQNIAKTYQHGSSDRPFRGILPLNLSVWPGEMVAIVGHPGAGKSTLLKILANWLVPDTGTITIDGLSLRDRPQLTYKIGFVSQTPNLFENFSVDYNLRLFTDIFRIPRRRIEEIFIQFQLEDVRSKKVHTLPKSIRQRVSFGRAMLTNPPILLLDEPTSGLDLESSKNVLETIRTLHNQSKTILVSSQQPEEIQNLATRLLVLQRGELVFDGTPKHYFESKAYETWYQ